jgi:universal stress protein A
MSTDTPLNSPTDSSTAKERAPAHSKEDALIYRSILVPVDFSENSEKVVSYAVRLASRDDPTLHLLHVFQAPFFGSTPYQGTRLKIDQIKSYESAAEQQAKENLEELLGRLQNKGIKVEAYVQSGYPFEQIIEVASRLKVDLIVIGSRSHTGLMHLLLGSTAERVVQHAPCPVLVVKEQIGQSTAGGAEKVQ